MEEIERLYLRISQPGLLTASDFDQLAATATAMADVLRVAEASRRRERITAILSSFSDLSIPSELDLGPVDKPIPRLIGA